MNTPTPRKSKCDRTPTKATCDRTPTPRTDEAWAAWQYAGSGMSVHVGRELERELTAVTEQLDLIEGMYQKVIAAVLDCDPIPACKRKNDQLEPPWEVITRIREQRDKLAEALKMIATFDYDDLQCDNGHGARYVATEALQSLTTNAKP